MRYLDRQWASHSSNVPLVEFDGDGTTTLEFGDSCSSSSAVNIALKIGV